MKRRPSLVQPVPAPTARNENLSDKGDIYDAPLYEVLAYSPGKAHELVPCTEVHLALCLTPNARVILRLKSARALDELVGVLLEHRKDVWGG